MGARLHRMAVKDSKCTNYCNDHNTSNDMRRWIGDAYFPLSPSKRLAFSLAKPLVWGPGDWAADLLVW